MQGGSPTDSGVLYWINGALDADPHYLCMNYNTMHVIWYQYIACTSMRVGMLNNIVQKESKKTEELTWLN